MGDIRAISAVILFAQITVVRLTNLPQNLNFSIPQAQEIWNSSDILGSSTQFNFPLSMGTINSCDDLLLRRAFDDEYNLFSNYTVWNPEIARNNLNAIARGYYAKRFSFRNTVAANTKISSEIVTLRGCFTACITMKDFVCREFDFYETENNICSLFMYNGNFGNTRDQYFVGNNPSSSHYTILKRSESQPECDLTPADYAYPYAGLGWKAMEAGWYDLAHDQFNKALERDPDFYMAHIGKALSNEDMGYGMSDNVVKSYRDKLNEIKDKPDIPLKLTFQFQLLLKALIALNNADNLQKGLKAMSDVFTDDAMTKTSYIDLVVAGNALLLHSDSFRPLQTRSENNVFALQYLTHNLNPYKNGKDRKSLPLREAAVDAVYTYEKMEVHGAWRISSDCIDITEYYAQWPLAHSVINSQLYFLARNIVERDDGLLKVQGEDIVVRGLNVTYMGQSLRRINAYERFHFYMLQMAQFISADELLRNSEEIDVQTKNMRKRMAANAYFTTYDYIYDKFAANMEFDDDWTKPFGDKEDDLAITSRAYYWTAAAVQALRAGKTGVVDAIVEALKAAKEKVGDQHYKNLIAIYENIIDGTQQERSGNYAKALSSAKEAKRLHDELANVDWRIANNMESEHFRLLIPIGYQFCADMMRTLRSSEEAKSQLADSLTLKDITEAYKIAVESPPLNTSRLIKGYGDVLLEEYGPTAKRKDEDRPAYVQFYETLLSAWKNSDFPEGDDTVKAKTEQTKEFYFDRPITDCQADLFQIRSEREICWGGYVVIGISVAVVVIIAIIIGILCLRQKGKAPQKDKEKAHEFIFSGPDLSSRDDLNGSYHMGSLGQGSPEATPYASQTLDIQRNFSVDSSSGSRNEAINAGYTEAYSAH